MRTLSRRRLGAVVTAATCAAVFVMVGTSPAAPVKAPTGPTTVTTDGAEVGALPRSPELTETTRLDDRRAVVIGERLYSTWSEDGLYPAAGWHTRGEMGGIWSPPVKLLDGLWFAVDGGWLGDDVSAQRFASGWGYTRTEYEPTGGVTVKRTDVVPDGPRAGLVGLTLHSDRTRSVTLALEAHSEDRKSVV